MKINQPNVYFIGAGPGDPDLITVKGKRLLETAHVIIYAGSLINRALIEGLNAEVYNSATMTLDEIVALIQSSVAEGKIVVRLHTGDTSFYSAITEQIDKLKELNISYEVVPGVSSAMAGAAVIGQELTIPEISQTVIFTRMCGNTPVPEKERLSALARHQATMVIFLSAALINDVKHELLQGYPPFTPVVVVYKASWQDQKVIRGVLNDLDRIVIEAGIKKTALIYIGEALRASEVTLSKQSRLYDSEFKHEFRK